MNIFMMPSARQLTLILATILLVALSVSATKTNNKLTATRSKSSDGKLIDLTTSPSMSNNQMVPMSMIPQQQQQLASNVYQSQSYLSPVRSGPISQSPSQVSMQTSASHHQAGDLSAAAGHHHKHHQPHGKYYEYREVPHKKAWKFGYKRGNHKHTIERHEHGKGPHFKTKVKWHDKKGKGVHLWDYNHYDKKKKHHG